MTEDIELLSIQTIKALIQKNLELVHKALGIGTTSHDDELSELEPEQKMVSDEVGSQFPKDKTYTPEELTEEKRYLATMRANNHAKFLQAQARFAESRTKFINRRRAWIER